ncbi:MAG: aminopeptidase P family protein [Rhizobiaceae bacterium]|nr:aminopeptidase P family protein [Rhizobiaceae bacterium]
MTEQETRLAELDRRIGEVGLDGMIITDADSIYYFTGCEDYIDMDFGRPSLLIVLRGETAVLMVPAGDIGMVTSMGSGPEILGWRDSAEGEWRSILADVVARAKPRKIGFESRFNPLVFTQFQSLSDAEVVITDEPIARMRLIKSASEIADLRRAGEIADAMMCACQSAIADGVPEYEISLAGIVAGTRKAAEALEQEGAHFLRSPMVSYLQVMKSGSNTDLGHCRPGLKKIVPGEPVAVCLCGMINYKHMKLAMDRPFYVGPISQGHADMTLIALESQEAALAAIKPGEPVEVVHEAASAVLQKHGHAPCTRTGRGLGASFTERPQIMTGDTTLMQPGMVLAVDGNLTIPKFGVQYGDSVLVTETGFEFLTKHTRELQVL